MQELQQRFDALQRGCDQLVGRVEAQRTAVAEAGAMVTALEADVALLTYVSAALQRLLNTVSEESLTAVEALVTYGLRVVFADQDLRLRLEVSTKRGAQSVEARLIHREVEGPILETFGGGPASVVSFLLRLMTVRRLRLAPVLLLDESFAMVSENYLPNVGQLLRELAEKTGMVILLVTHQPELLGHAHRAYEAVETSHGTVFRALPEGGVA